MRVVTAIAAATDQDPTTMEPIFGSVDPDALDRLFDADADVWFQFEYEGHLVEVDSDGRVVVDGAEFEVVEE